MKDDDELIATLWRRGGRAAAIGALIGGGVDLLLTAGLIALLGVIDSSGSSDVLSIPEMLLLLPYAALPLVFGALIGLFVAGSALAQRMTQLAGYGPGARRLRDQVLRGAPSVSADDDERALRWARLAAAYLPYQALGFALLYVGLIVNQARMLVAPPDGPGWIPWTSAALITVLVVVALALFPLQLRNARRAREYVRRRTSAAR